MFSDLVGSTALSARMDPEDLREVISSYQKCVAETVKRFGGFPPLPAALVGRGQGAPATSSATPTGRRWPNARPGARSGAGVGVSEARLHSSLPGLSR